MDSVLALLFLSVCRFPKGVAEWLRDASSEADISKSVPRKLNFMFSIDSTLNLASI